MCATHRAGTPVRFARESTADLCFRLQNRDIRVARHALFSQQDSHVGLIQQPDQNSSGSAPYSLHDRP
jgi:hypothetical protein